LITDTPLLLVTLSVVIVSAGGNPTALVERPAVPRELRPQIASFLMRTLAPEAEQVGFLGKAEDADLRLDMPGDELCINGLRSAATLAFAKSEDNASSLVATSGYATPIRCRVAPADDRFRCTIYLRVETESTRIDDNLHLALFDTIAHFTLACSALPSAKEAETLAAEARLRPEVRDYPAVGFIPFRQNGDELAIAPVVYTRSIDTAVHETACGSGSIAAALHAQRPGRQQFRVIQPSGSVYDVGLARHGSGWIATLASEMTIGRRQRVVVPPFALA
jgi:diaminopimelate epimerase